MAAGRGFCVGVGVQPVPEGICRIGGICRSVRSLQSSCCGVGQRAVGTTFRFGKASEGRFHLASDTEVTT